MKNITKQLFTIAAVFGATLNATEAENNQTQQNTKPTQTWEERYNEALEKQMAERREVLTNRPFNNEKLNEMIERQRLVMLRLQEERKRVNQ
ncbi:MAG: hypothetical protein IJO11_01260 [Alphaproteobacteria bacterium]|nr:hypothetical protein [Alphaproteobacteria bacterium]MBQ6854055.1 hypothetical protein [Alphaproteobacteria bacterium]